MNSTCLKILNVSKYKKLKVNYACIYMYVQYKLSILGSTDYWPLVFSIFPMIVIGVILSNC